MQKLWVYLWVRGEMVVKKRGQKHKWGLKIKIGVRGSSMCGKKIVKKDMGVKKMLWGRVGVVGVWWKKMV